MARQIRMSHIADFGRSFFHKVVSGSWQQKLLKFPLMQGLRETMKQSADTSPYVLLGQQQIDNLQIVLNRNSFLAQLPKDGVVAEIGVADGQFSQRIMQFASPAKLYLLDAWDSPRYAHYREQVRNKFEEQTKMGQIVIQQGYSVDLLPQFPDHFFDWVYLDTDHSYETTRAELELCRHKVKAGGIIAGHDYIIGDWELRNRYGVVEAVNEFCVRHNWEMILLTHETHRHLSFALRQLP